MGLAPTLVRTYIGRRYEALLGQSEKSSRDSTSESLYQKTMENALSIHSIAALFVKICAHDEKSLQKLRKKEKKYYLCNL